MSGRHLKQSQAKAPVADPFAPDPKAPRAPSPAEEERAKERRRQLDEDLTEADRRKYRDPARRP